jgi:O-antigen/teichoic acid export membrane protein
MRWVSGNIYMIVAGAVLGPVAVGAIRGTQNLMGLCHVFLLGFENVVPVTAARRYHEGGMKALSTYIGKVGLLGAAALGAVIAVAAVAPAFWLDLIYGDVYRDDAYLVWWWAASYSIGFVGGLANVGLRAVEETKPIFVAFLVSSLVAVATVYPVVNLLGVVGVIVGYILHEAIRLVCLYHGLLRFRAAHG